FGAASRCCRLGDDVKESLFLSTPDWHIRTRAGRLIPPLPFDEGAADRAVAGRGAAAPPGVGRGNQTANALEGWGLVARRTGWWEPHGTSGADFLPGKT